MTKFKSLFAASIVAASSRFMLLAVDCKAGAVTYWQRSATLR